ncbi:MAG: hypothetical protein J0M15_06475 [Deltaproteobacteria bacterium]|nr:hypothetical protein [Deltaproteobacteria bacterium]
MFKQVIYAAILILSVALQAQEVYWKKQSVNLTVNSSDNNKSSYNQVFQRVVLQHNYYECGYYTDPVVQVVTGTCYETTCTGSAGKSAAWDAFYSAKKEDKANRLAAAIKGVGKSSAESLLAQGFFHSKPRSWNEFKTEINRAASQGAITAQVATLVLSTYRSDNMANLGYSGGCTSTPYACDEVRVIREGYYVPQTCDNAMEQVIDTKPMSFQFEVKNAVLLPSEQEQLTFHLSGNLNEITLDSSNYNNYQFVVNPISNNAANIDVLGSGRKQVYLPGNAFQSVQLIPVDKKAATLQVSVSPNVLPVDATEQLMLSYEVRTCAVGWLGTCGFGWDKKQTFNGSLTTTVTNFPVSTDLAPGKKGLRMEVEVKIYKQNSIYHNATPASKVSDKITLK